MELDRIDTTAAAAFEGFLVRKDLVRTFSRQFPVPTYVVEFLLGRYCASTDLEEIEEGLGHGQTPEGEDDEAPLDVGAATRRVAGSGVLCAEAGTVDVPGHDPPESVAVALSGGPAPEGTTLAFRKRGGRGPRDRFPPR